MDNKSSTAVKGHGKRRVVEEHSLEQDSEATINLVAVAGVHRVPLLSSPAASIAMLKKDIALRLGLQPSHVRLMHMGRELADTAQTVLAANLSEGATLAVFPSGGRQIPDTLPSSSSTSSSASSGASAGAAAARGKVQGKRKRAHAGADATAAGQDDSDVVTVDDEKDLRSRRPSKRANIIGRLPSAGELEAPPALPQQAGQPAPYPYCSYAGPPYFFKESLPSSSSSGKGSTPKRPHRFRERPTEDISARLGRAVSQRMIFLDRQPLNPGEPSYGSLFRILGTTGNLYTVRFDSAPRCDCPDGQRHPNCKHLLYIKLRVLRIPSSNPLLWQDGYLPWEVAYMMSHGHGGGGLEAGRTPATLISASASGSSSVAVPSGPEQQQGTGSSKRRVPAPDDDCPICFDSLGSNLSSLAWCTTCGNNVHKECFNSWAKQKRAAREAVTCVHCRSPWLDDPVQLLQGLHAALSSASASAAAGRAGAGSSGASPGLSSALSAALGSGSATPGVAGSTVGREGYLNFGQVLGLPTGRDTSSYYSGPVRRE